MAMNKNLQISTMKQKLKNMGVEPDLIDLESYVDGRLTFEENWHDIYDMIEPIMEAEEAAPSQDPDKLERYEKAEVQNELRSRRARRRDKEIHANTSFGLTSLTKKNYQRWKEDPSHYDIDGVDNKAELY